MRRLRTSRTDLPEPGDLEGFERLELEGDPVTTGPDAIASLRPFGQDVDDQTLGTPDPPGATGDERIERRAAGLAARRRRLQAIQILREHSGEHPRAVGPRLALAALLEEAGEADRAAAEVTIALEVEPDSPELLVRRGALYAQTGRVADAEQDFKEAIRREPSHFPAYRYLGIARLRRGVPAEAVVHLRQALELRPDDAEATLHLGEALAGLGQIEDALGILQRAAALCPGDPRSYKIRGRLLDRLGRTEEAMAMHKQAREVTTA